MSAEYVEIAKRVTNAYNRRDIDTVFAELATPDFEWGPALTKAYEGGCYRGREGAERIPARTGRSSKALLRNIVISVIGCFCWVGSRDAARAAALRWISRTRPSST